MQISTKKKLINSKIFKNKAYAEVKLLKQGISRLRIGICKKKHIKITNWTRNKGRIWHAIKEIGFTFILPSNKLNWSGICQLQTKLFYYNKKKEAFTCKIMKNWIIVDTHTKIWIIRFWHFQISDLLPNEF